MSYQKESFGIMDEGYFVPRGEILDWLNNTLDLNLTKIQQLGSGAVYCQVVDIIHPGKVTMNKVNWRAKNDYQFINNLKILQVAFDKAGVKRYVQVQKLSKAKYQDNLQFIQWLKRYYDTNCGDRGNDYNAQQKRGNAQVDFSFADKNIVIKSFNGTGQVVSKNQLPGKKTTQVLPQKGSIIEQKVQTKQPPKRKQEKNVTSFGGKADWQALYKRQAERNKELRMKLNMVKQTVQTDDDPSMKLSIIHQLLNGDNGNKNEKMEVQYEQDQNI